MDNIILFDSTCRLCNCTVHFLKNTDKDKKLLFIPINSLKGKEYIHSYHLNENDKNSVVHIHEDKYYTKSEAVLSVLALLKKYKTLYYILRLVPKHFRNSMYDLIANNRYKWFGKIKYQNA